MKSTLLLIICISLFIGCSTKKTKDVILVNDYYFKVMPGEAIADNSKDIVDKYEKYFNNDDSIQIPLYKYIKNKDYQIFIGLPVSAVLQQLQARETVHDSVLIVQTGQNTAYYQYTKDTLFLTHYYTMPDNKNITAAFALTSSKKISDSLLSEHMLSERIYK